MVRITCIRSFPGQNHWKGGSQSDKVKNPGPHCGFSSESKMCDIQSLVSQWPLRPGVNHRWITNHPTTHMLFATLGQLRPTSFFNFLIFGHFHAWLFSIFFLMSSFEHALWFLKITRKFRQIKFCDMNHALQYLASSNANVHLWHLKMQSVSQCEWRLVGHQGSLATICVECKKSVTMVICGDQGGNNLSEAGSFIGGGICIWSYSWWNILLFCQVWCYTD